MSTEKLHKRHPMERGAAASRSPHGIQRIKANSMFPAISSLPPTRQTVRVNSRRGSGGDKNQFKRAKNISTRGGPGGNSLPTGSQGGVARNCLCQPSTGAAREKLHTLFTGNVGLLLGHRSLWRVPQGQKICNLFRPQAIRKIIMRARKNAQ